LTALIASLALEGCISTSAASAAVEVKDNRPPLVCAPNCEGRTLRGMGLSGVNLRRANLGFAHLRGVILIGANMSHADLRVADLRGANLTSARLEEANLTSALGSRANLTGANLGARLAAGASRPPEPSPARAAPTSTNLHAPPYE
jgi:uncharacterized protein YjbI with pentapeptide repeats